jgi:hypothetical protein
MLEVLLWVGVLILSCVVAELASGGRGTWLWGVFGPAGWFVAAMRGMHMRFEDAFPSAIAAPEPEPKYHAPPRLRGATRRRRREREQLAAEQERAADTAAADEVEHGAAAPDEDPPA